MSSTNIHRKKLFGGRYTAEEVHQQLAFPPGKKCGCGARPIVRAIVMMELDEAIKANPDLQVAQFTHPQEFMAAVVQIKSSDGRPKPYMRISVAYACKSCRPHMEKVLAKTPSHCIVEINNPPTPDKIQIGYGS